MFLSEQVVQIVECASKYNFVIIPFGGGTSVSGSVTCPEQENRPIVVLDTSDMNSILWIDKEQLLARLQVNVLNCMLLVLLGKTFRFYISTTATALNPVLAAFMGRGHVTNFLCEDPLILRSHKHTIFKMIIGGG